MIKNIVFDIGGVILNTKNKVISNFLQIPIKQIKELTKMVFGSKQFRQCLLGNMTQEQVKKQLIQENPKAKNEIEVLLGKIYQQQLLPVIPETVELLYQLQNQNHNIYFLSNLTEATYDYLKNELQLLDDFKGGVYSWQEHMVKPNKQIYQIVLDRYQLKKEETIFFDDTLKNVQVGNQLGIKSIQFENAKQAKTMIQGENRI